MDDPGDFGIRRRDLRERSGQRQSGRKKLMFAPDAAQGPDGRYYLYYGLSDVAYIGVAVSSSPAGPFEYYGRVAYQDGTCPDGLAFDPGVSSRGRWCLSLLRFFMQGRGSNEEYS